MARGAIEIPIASETGAFEKGIRNGVIEPIQDAEKELRKLGDTNSGKDIDRDLKKAQDATEDLSSEVKEAARNLDKLSYKAKDIGDTSKTSFHEASENVQGFKEEAVQNLSEVASSFTGDMSQMADGVQGLTGGLASALTPGIGIPLAIIGATAGAFLAKWQEDAKATEQLVADMYDDMLQSGNRYLSAQFVQKGIGEIVGDQGKFNDALAKSKELSVSVNDVIRAMAGDQSAVNDLLGQQASKRQAELDAINKSSESLENKSVKIDAVNAKYAAQDGWLTQITKSEDSAANRFDAANAAQSDYFASLINSAESAQLEVDEVGNKVYELPDGTQILIDAETGRATTDLSKFKGDLDGVAQTVVNPTVKVRVDTSAWDNWRPTPKAAQVRGQVQAF